MVRVSLEQDTIDRLDALREEEESYDELIIELINILETNEQLLAGYGDEF